MSVKKLTACAVVAAAYVILTYTLVFFSYEPIQIRVAEALTVIPYFGSWGIAAVSVGCFIANIMSPYGLIDMIFGTAATVIGAIGTFLLTRSKKELWFLAPLPPVIANSLMIPLMLCFESGVLTVGSFGMYAVYTFIGESVSCFGIGIPVMILLRKNKHMSEIMSSIK